MSKIAKLYPMRKEWRLWLLESDLTQQDVAIKAGLSVSTVCAAMRDGIASEHVREGLRRVGVPEHLIPLPNSARVLASMLYEQRANA